MNYMGDATWWNERFKNRNLNIMKPDKCLEEDISLFDSKRTILDVACGDGRNAIYLAKLGFDVHGIDFSTEAIKRLKYFASIENVSVQTNIVDLVKDGFDDIQRTYDAILINHYRLPSQLYCALMERLNNGGILWVNGFEKVPQNNPNVKESDILCETDFETLNQYTFIGKKTYEWNDNSYVRYGWRK